MPFNSVWDQRNKTAAMIIPLMMQRKRDEQEITMKARALKLEEDKLRALETEKSAELKRKIEEAQTKNLVEMWKVMHAGGDEEGIQPIGRELDRRGLPVSKKLTPSLAAQDMSYDEPYLDQATLKPNLRYLVKPKEEKQFTNLEQFLANQPGMTEEKALELKKKLVTTNPNFKTFYDKTGNPNTIDTTKDRPDPTWSEDKPDKKTSPSTAMGKYIQDNPEATSDEIAQYAIKLKGPQETPAQKETKNTLIRLEDDIMQTEGRIANLRAGVNIMTTATDSERPAAIATLEKQLETMKTQYKDLGGKRKFGGETKQDTRTDGTPKGPGWLGTLKTTDGSGKVSTEISVGVNIDGKETLIPTLVPTLTKQEVDHLLAGGKPNDAIVKKAVEHARKQIKNGKSPFKEQAEPTEEEQKEYNKLRKSGLTADQALRKMGKIK